MLRCPWAARAASLSVPTRTKHLVVVARDRAYERSDGFADLVRAVFLDEMHARHRDRTSEIEYELGCARPRDAGHDPVPRRLLLLGQY
jgi:hypothetical protein